MKLTFQLAVDALIRAMRARGHDLARQIEPRRAACVRPVRSSGSGAGADA